MREEPNRSFARLIPPHLKMLVSDRHDNKNPDGEDELNDESVIGIALDAPKGFI